MDKQITRESQIRIDVGLNAAQLPVQIRWEADDQDTNGPVDCKAVLLSLFERESKETLRIDLWTQDMQIAEMDRLIFHTIRSLADTYLKASQHVDLAREFQAFAHYFGEKTGIINPPA
ncbi:MAG: gliding motility protein GldC [Saprospiraceae bacterium]|nr:gliding motility protein GldC [Saprospiraceae bacterium]